MKTFEVVAYATYREVYVVDANTAEEANEMVVKGLDGADDPVNIEFHSYTDSDFHVKELSG